LIPSNEEDRIPNYLVLTFFDEGLGETTNCSRSVGSILRRQEEQLSGTGLLGYLTTLSQLQRLQAVFTSAPNHHVIKECLGQGNDPVVIVD
jgi:hypothetical protein